MLDIRTGKKMTRRDFGKGIAAILGSGVAPSIALGTASLAGSANGGVRSGIMRNVAARNAAMFGGEAPKQYDWVDGFYINQRGVIIEDVTKSYSKPIVFPNGKTVRYVSNLREAAVVGFNKNTGAYWNDVVANDVLEVGLWYRDWITYSWAKYQFSCVTETSSRCYVYNVTDNEYVMKDNVIAEKYRIEG